MYWSPVFIPCADWTQFVEKMEFELGNLSWTQFVEKMEFESSSLQIESSSDFQLPASNCLACLCRKQGSAPVDACSSHFYVANQRYMVRILLA